MTARTTTDRTDGSPEGDPSFLYSTERRSDGSIRIMSAKKPINIVTIGGGGGHSQILKGLKRLPGVRITAICPSTDSGGSTGHLVREYKSRGFLGDLTKCIAALCPDEQLSRSLMYRFEHGVLAGHSVKNILLLGMEQTSGLGPALDLMYEVARIAPHRVIPVVTHASELRATLRLGNEVRGETNIDLIAQNPLWHPDVHAIERVWLRPRVRATPEVLRALNAADVIVVSPGDLYSSILPVLLPVGVTGAIRRSRAHIAVVLNIMTKQGETHGYSAEDFLHHIERFLGRPGDSILYNTAAIPRRAQLAYALERKVQLRSESLRRDPRVRALPLLKVTPAGEMYHDERAVARAVAMLARRR